jgi:hypothetical protein
LRTKAWTNQAKKVYREIEKMGKEEEGETVLSKKLSAVW